MRDPGGSTLRLFATHKAHPKMLREFRLASVLRYRHHRKGRTIRAAFSDPETEKSARSWTAMGQLMCTETRNSDSRRSRHTQAEPCRVSGSRLALRPEKLWWPAIVLRITTVCHTIFVAHNCDEQDIVGWTIVASFVASAPRDAYCTIRSHLTDGKRERQPTVVVATTPLPIYTRRNFPRDILHSPRIRAGSS